MSVRNTWNILIIQFFTYSVQLLVYKIVIQVIIDIVIDNYQHDLNMFT